MGDEAQAVAEIAKTTTKVAELAEKLGGFMNQVIGGATTQIGGVLEDWTRYFRYKNLLAISDKVEAVHKQRSIEGKTIPIVLKQAFPLLEAASLEEDDTLQNVWARLIANSMDPTFTLPIHPGCTDIIKQLTPDEAVILNAFCKFDIYPVLFWTNEVITDIPQPSDSFAPWVGPSNKTIHQSGFPTISSQYLKWCKTLNLKQPDHGHSYLDNLKRLQIVELESELINRKDSIISHQPEEEKHVHLLLQRDERLKITTFGDGFIKACINES